MSIPATGTHLDSESYDLQNTDSQSAALDLAMPEVNFTVAAATMVQQLIDDEQNPALMLRVSIQGGGCSGFQYGFDLTDEQQDDDHLTVQTIAWPPLVEGAVGSVQGAGADVGPGTADSGSQGDQGDQGVQTATGAEALEDGAEAVDGGDVAAGRSSVAVKLLIDPLSLNYLAGATIDYREDVHGARFVISNPNAKTTCGCGASFSG